VADQREPAARRTRTDPAAGSARPARRFSAGVVPVRVTAAGARFLLLRAYRYWDFPKGLVAPGEDPLAAALRELCEETSIDQVELAWGAEYYETAPYAGGKVARYYLGRTRQEAVTLPVSPELGRPEHHEYRWVGTDQGYALLGDRVAAALRWAAARCG
jgi:8-oxo-dGTP pyrophosphatase MutT (NUDIX family)